MRFGVCLNAGAVARGTLRLHETDSRALELGLAAGAEVIVVEVVGQRGSAPLAVAAALACGASRAVRVVDPALERANARATGFVLATTLDRLEVDLILFGADADPEGVADVPACIARHMSALYLADALDLATVSSSSPGPAQTSAVDVTISEGGSRRRLRVPLNAVIGVAPATSPLHAPISTSTASASAVSGGSLPHGSVEVLSLADLNIDPALIHNHHDGRGLIDAAPRPLVTLQSAAAIAALLRR